MFNYSSNFKLDLAKAVFWILIAVLIAGFLLGSFWMIGHATHDADVLRHQQEIDCIKNLGTPIYNSTELQCRK